MDYIAPLYSTLAGGPVHSRPRLATKIPDPDFDRQQKAVLKLVNLPAIFSEILALVP